MAVGTKSIKQTTERVVHICDRCAKQIDSWRNCTICRIEAGYCCSKLMLGYHNEPGYYDLAFFICKDCEEAGRDVCGVPLIGSIRDKTRECDEYTKGIIERWKEWAKERAEKAKGVG